MTHEPNVCAWCIHRDGDICLHPQSPVNRHNFRTFTKTYLKGECGPVCNGEVECTKKATDWEGAKK